MAKEVKTKKRTAKRVPERGAAHIHASFHNTIVTITDAQGNAISWSSAGKLKYRGSKKKSQFVGEVVAQDAAAIAVAAGMKYVDVFVTGAGQGRESAIRALQVAGLQVTSIKDVSPIPHNGCRPPKHRRL